MGEYYHLTLFADLEGKPEQRAERDAVVERFQGNFRTSSSSHGGTAVSNLWEDFDGTKRLTHVCHVKSRDHDALLEALETLEPFLRRHGLMGYIASESDSIDIIWNDYDRGVVVGSIDEFQARDDE